MPSPSSLIVPGAVALLLALPPSLAAQRVTIKGASPSDVVGAIQKQLATQGFKLADSSKKRPCSRSIVGWCRRPRRTACR
jgi:hypothetical protein